MSFISEGFFLFIAILILVYYLLPKKWQPYILLVASYAFYVFSGWTNVAYILVTTLSTFFGAHLVVRYENKRKESLSSLEGSLDSAGKKAYRKKTISNKRWITAAVLVLNFGILFVVKYYEYFATKINNASGSQLFPIVDIVLPLGISFFTFQAVGYMIDVYRGMVKPEKSIFKYALFISFFPQLVQGPISRYDKLAPQLTAEHKFNGQNLKYALLLAIWGYFKKMVIADKLYIAVTAWFSMGTELGGAQVLIAGLATGIRVYCDFSGGIDITRAVACALGIDLMQNFNQPFFANSMADFWHRWHISLTEWMRDYVFYSFAFSKPFNNIGKWGKKHFGKDIGKLIPTIIVTLINFLLIGIWHGANFKYVVYGLYNGIVIAIGMLSEPFVKKLYTKWNFNSDVLPYRIFQIIRTLFFVTIGRILTNTAYWKDGITMVKNIIAQPCNGSLFGDWWTNSGVSVAEWIVVGVGIVILFVVGFMRERGTQWCHLFDSVWKPAQVAFIVLSIMAILIFGVYGLEYSSASFHYGGF